jgi:signal transduction histidine kinase
MNRDGGTGVHLRPLWQPLAGGLLALVFAILLAWAAWAAIVTRQPAGAAEAVGPGAYTTLFFLILLPALMFALFAALALRAARRQQQLADALRDARERIRSVDELLDVWQWQTDANHRLTGLRPPQGAASTDWSATRSSGLLWEHFKVADEAALRAQLQGAAALHDVEVQHTTAPGTPRTGRLRARARSDTMGGFAGYRGTFREVEHASGASEPAARAAMAPAPTATAPEGPGSATDIGQEHESFSYTISHDLRAPIRVVEGFTKIVKEDYGRLLDRVGNDHLDRVLGAAARMNNMIDALLALSKLSSQPLACQSVNLSQLAGYVADDLRRQWPERRVTIDIEPGIQVQGDATLLRVVIENLLGNAWKYTGKCAEGQIGFERSAQGTDMFTVRDNGAGFDMRYADRLFGVFQRLHSANDFPGTGVGLASVRRIVRRHGGEIWGEAEVNQGARFHFSLPQGQPRD